MAEMVNMPKLGFDMQEGMLVRWVKQVGDEIQSGDVIAEVETDKATIEIEAYATGTIRKHLVEEDSIVEVGSPIAIVGGPDEDISDVSPDGGEAAAEQEPPAEEKAEPAAEPKAPTTQAETPEPSPNGKGYPGGIKASPVARRMAQEKGIDLQKVSGSGPGGRIIKQDVEGFTPGEEAPAAPAMETPRTQAPTYEVPTGPDVEEIPLSRMRKIVGERTQESFQFVPHFYVTSEYDMAAVLALRKEINASITPEEKVSVNDMIVKAVALALRDFPNLNSHFHSDKIVRHKRINVGIAVAVENGLINVVCQDADKRTLTDISVSNKAMIQRARDGKIKPDDVEGATFTVSNLGPYDVEHFLAIINPPESGILAVGSAREVPVVVDGEIKVGVRMKATISVDHRVSDGAEGAEFMQRLKELFNEPMRLLV